MCRWLKPVLALAAIVLMVLVILSIGSVALKMLDAYRGETGTHDPMFAEEPVRATREPVQTEEPRVFEDNSANWVIPNHTPVDPVASDVRP